MSAIHLDNGSQQREERRTSVYDALIHDQDVHRLNTHIYLGTTFSCVHQLWEPQYTALQTDRRADSRTGDGAATSRQQRLDQSARQMTVEWNQARQSRRDVIHWTMTEHVTGHRPLTKMWTSISSQSITQSGIVYVAELLQG